MTYYKVVENRTGRLTSVMTPTRYKVRYHVDEPVRAAIGKLFVFDDLDHAHMYSTYMMDIFDRLEIWACDATQVEVAPDWCLTQYTLSMSSDQCDDKYVEEFWEEISNNRYVHGLCKTPAGTLFADTVTLRRKIQ